MAKKKKVVRKTKKKKKSSPIFEHEVLFYIYNLIVITVALIGGLSVGLVGEFLNKAMRYIVGEMYFIAYLLIIAMTLYLMIKKSFQAIQRHYIFAFVLLFLICTCFFATTNDQNLVGKDVLDFYLRNTEFIFNGTFRSGGGIIGALIYSGTSILFGKVGTYIVLIVLTIIALLAIMEKETRSKLGSVLLGIPRKIGSLFKRSDVKNIEDTSKPEFFQYEEEVENVEDYADLLDEPITQEAAQLTMDIDELRDAPIEDEVIDSDGEAQYMQDFSTYRLPRINLLTLAKKSAKSSANTSAAGDAGKRLVHILQQFGVNASLVATHIGPSVTKFELRPEVGVRVNRISGLQQDIKMGLAAKDIRIEAPIPGKSTVGIEIPNMEKTLVNMRDLMRLIPSGSENKKLLFALGKDLMGNCVYGELNKMPHLLIAGATGSGKSVCVNSIITSIIMRAKPDEVQFLLIDPKKVEFSQYAGIPHLIAPVITDGEEASRALKVVVKMMEDRYELFSKAGVRNIGGYNEAIMREANMKKMPWLVVIIDELADLMLVAAKDVEASIQRITQLARAAGIHLVVATQRPSVDVITGVIKANIPSRIAFAVSSAIDSRTILDQQGAEKLLGLGDMLYIPQGENNPVRVQGCFVSDEEVTAVANACASQAKPRYEDTFIRLEAVDNGTSNANISDPLYEDVRNFVIESRKASTSFIQRKFSIGYARAARLVDTLEDQGVIGPQNGSKPREVFVKAEIHEEEK